MRHLALFFLALPLLAVDGVVTNGTTGKPQAGVRVTLVQAGAGGMQEAGSVTSGADGKFEIPKVVEGMLLVQAHHKGVTYTKALQPGAPVTDVQVQVFDATRDPAAAKLTQHIVFLQPTAEQISVNEVFFLKNDGKLTYDTPDGTLRFAFADGPIPEKSIRVMVSAPGGMPVERPVEKAGPPGIAKVVFPVKPGETEFNVSYALPAGKTFSGKNVMPVSDTRLVVPRGVTLAGEGVTALGEDPGAKVSIYSTNGQRYKVSIEGTGQVQSSPSPDAAPDDDSGAPQMQQVKPHLYEQLPVVVALAAAILLLGFVDLYRRSLKGPSAK